MIGVLDAPMIVDVPDEAQPMKLSDAIRIGSQLRGKCKNLYYDPRTETTCALGAAFEAMANSELTLFSCDSTQLDEFFVALRNDSPVHSHPVNSLGELTLYSIIMSLNDEYDWTRQEIADWLAGQGL